MMTGITSYLIVGALIGLIVVIGFNYLKKRKKN